MSSPNGERAIPAARFALPAAALLIAVVAWLLARGEPASTPVHPTPDASSARDTDVTAEPALAAVPSRGGERSEAAEAAPPAPTAAPAQAERGEATSAGTYALLARFVRPDREPLRLAQATLELVGDRGDRHDIAVREAESAEVRGLRDARYVVRVRADGHRHAEQSLERSDALARDPGHEPVCHERLYLWPERWIAIVVRTPDGRPFRAIADELGIEPVRLFVGAFDARARLDPPDEGSWAQPQDPSIAVFREPPGYQSWELPGACAGSLELVRAVPENLWVGLVVLGSPLEWQPIAPSATEAVFELDAAALERRFARVRLRVLDEDGNAATDARVTLRADTSAHRRSEHEQAAPADDGRVELARLVPGRYELTIARGDALHQGWVELAAGETRDLGEIELGLGARLALRVVREDGRPAAAWIEIGTYRRGASADEIYPPMLSRHTGAEGELSIPLPSAPAIVRATAMDAASSHPTDDRSYNALVDPQAPPAQPLVLVVHEPAQARIDVLAPAARRVEVLDDLDVVVASRTLAGAGSWELELVRGSYRVRLEGAGGEPLGETRLEMAGAPRTVELP